MKKPLSKEEKQKLRQQLRQDTKSYYVSAVLDKAASERLLRPLPTELELQGRDGGRLVLSIEPGPTQPLGKR